MAEYRMTELEARNTNTNLQAYIGDAVYEVAVRERLIAGKKCGVDKIHRQAVRYVSADGQAKAIKALACGFLTETEVKVYKRGRNHRSSSRPKNANPRTYKIATGFEAMLGYLYLSGQDERLEAVMNEAIRVIEEE